MVTKRWMKQYSKTITKGNMSTLNCPEEVKLAEKLIEINPWAEMVRFARSGGEANSIAIRIARAASLKDNVAVCGYHGWHDWYLSANHNQEDNLSSHLLEGLNPKGFLKSLKGTVFPFRYNNYEELVSIVKTKKYWSYKDGSRKKLSTKKKFFIQSEKTGHSKKYYFNL